MLSSRDGAATWDKTRNQVYDQLLELLNIKDVPGLADVDAAQVKALLVMNEGGGNAGNAMTQHIKWACKYHRGRGVHVTPTVHVNGLEAGVISSGWTCEQWLAFLEPMGEDKFTGSKVA